jgi:hypothetical protein
MIAVDANVLIYSTKVDAKKANDLELVQST